MLSHMALSDKDKEGSLSLSELLSKTMRMAHDVSGNTVSVGAGERGGEAL